MNELQTPLFSRRALLHLMAPLIVQLIFTALMGTAYTMMVARVGDAAVSGVSLVDTLNNLMLMVFTATATGGTVVCAQFLGAGHGEDANRAARQVLLCVAAISLLCCGLCLGLRRPLLHLIFGAVEDRVMDAAMVYFLVTVDGLGLGWAKGSGGQLKNHYPKGLRQVGMRN